MLQNRVQSIYKKPIIMINISVINCVPRCSYHLLQLVEILNAYCTWYQCLKKPNFSEPKMSTSKLGHKLEIYKSKAIFRALMYASKAKNLLFYVLKMNILAFLGKKLLPGLLKITKIVLNCHIWSHCTIFSKFQSRKYILCKIKKKDRHESVAQDLPISQ